MFPNKTNENGAVFSPMLKGAVDLHVHAFPDVIPRARNVGELSQEADEAGMTAILLKDHCFPTHGMAYTSNLTSRGCRFYGSIALNPTVGGLNPAAVEAAISAGAAAVFFPTYSAAHHLATMGDAVLPMPLPSKSFKGYRILDSEGKLIPAAREIIETVTRRDVILATGHLNPEETLALVRFATGAGAKRVLVTHASEVAPGLTVEQQCEAAMLGAVIEHSVLATTDAVPNRISIKEMAAQIRKVGPEHVVVSSDFGKKSLGSPVIGFGRALEELAACGFTSDEILLMVRTNPLRLLPE